MAGIVITEDGNSIIVATNDYSDLIGTTRASFNKSDVGIIYRSKTDDYINMTIKAWKDISMDITGTGTRIKVDSVLGVDCTTLETLFNQLTKMRG